jgi:cytidine deaminase
MDEAKEASEHAYSPYSKFKVGAAILTKKGNIYKSANIENASYSLTICAERNAATKAVFNHDTDFELIAVYVDSEILFPPCGACRQFLSEFAPTVPIIYFNKIDSYKYRLDELLPFSFQLNDNQ